MFCRPLQAWTSLKIWLDKFSHARRAASLLLIPPVAALLSACSMHPSLEDVSYPVRTEDVVRHARCEIRNEFLTWFRKTGLDLLQEAKKEEKAENKLKTLSDEQLIAGFKKAKQLYDEAYDSWNVEKIEKLSNEVKIIGGYLSIGIAFDITFDIIETNSADGSIGFRLPFTAPAALDVGANAALSLTRQGLRQFKLQDVLWDLIEDKKELCGSTPQSRNIVYPLTGEIGLGSVTLTFLELVRQGGGKDSFVETWRFTTDIKGGVNATLKLNPVPRRFRVVSATAKVDAGRKDIHQIVVSLAFPRPPRQVAIGTPGRTRGALDAPFERPALWRARYNICVVEARTREDKFNTLRHFPPENSCIDYADAFAPINSKAVSEAATEVTRTSARTRIVRVPQTVPSKDQIRTQQLEPVVRPAPRATAPRTMIIPYGTERPDR